MMKTIKILTLSLSVLSLSITSAYAQVREEFSNEIEVTREYNPEVGEAQKLAVIPGEPDTSELKPDIGYSINPTRWETAFGVRPINPVRISTASYDPHKPFFVRFGAGYPLKTIGDLSISTPATGNSTLGFYLNHDGQWGKIENDLGEKRAATESVTRALLHYSRQFKSRSLSVEGAFANRLYKPYGAFELPGYQLADYYGNTDPYAYNDAGVKLAFGDTFTDMVKLNFGIEARGSMFWGEDGNDLFDIGAAFRLGQSIDRGGSIIVGMDVDYIQGLKSLSGYENYTAGITPVYSFSDGRLDFSIGAGLVYDSRYKGGKLAVIPRMDLRYGVADAFVPYVTIEGDIHKADHRTLSYLNPYILAGIYDGNGVVRTGRAGFGGSAGFFTYDIYFCAEIWKQYRIFANVYDNLYGSTRFTTVIADNATIMYPAIGVNMLLARGLNLSVDGRYNMISVDDITRSGQTVTPGTSIADYDVNLGLRYSYRDKLFVSVNTLFSGKASHTVVRNPSTAPTLYIEHDDRGSIDLSAEIEYKLRAGFSAFIRGENLLNDDLTVHNHYPLQSTGVLLGVKLTF